MRGSSGETHLYILKVKCLGRNQEVGREGYGWMISQNGLVSKHMVRQKG